MCKDIDNIRGIKNEFAQSLVKQFDEKGSLSDKQWFWVKKLSQPPLLLLHIQAMMDVARDSGLTWPKLQYDDLVISLFAPYSKYAGQLKVMFGLRYAGRIEKGLGHIHLSEAADKLKDFDTDVIGKAALQGRLTGRCCFCGRDLTTKESVGVGYGPVCADRWGLPWGSRTEYDEAKRDILGTI